MKSDPRCAPCLLNRTLYEANLSTKDQSLIFEVMESGLEYLRDNFREGVNATNISTGIHRRAYAILGDDDPYREIKAQSNVIGKKLMPAVRKRVLGALENDRFRIAVLASIVGNNFDFGLQEHQIEIGDFESLFAEEMERGLQVDDTGDIMRLARNGRVAYLTDNCGEIYFDELVLELLKAAGAHVTLVVRGGNIVTDATMDDVRSMGLAEKVNKVLTTGSNAIGVCMRELPPETLRAMSDADVIISKGMANYEALSDERFRPIAYLLRAKCEPVSRSIGVKKGWNVARLVK
ncbi:MAG TPA: ARMT1-like domain-containing protein [Methanocella sp.]|uniref:damage-control phosphatase ARMT1 family protein n=1 Tax=Methanocella sp. TaxID=2052833 RepID=UPI002D135449|nr:ARMT1-like domain-containing protein [Methanocella sp.]HTY91624.1 ARMT1-like domain-containing protein [Methanocella sp.]